MKKIMLGISMALLCTAACSASYTKNFTVAFNTGHTYKISIDNDSLSWKGILGEDKNMELKTKIKHLTLSQGIEVFQWKEDRGNFVTFIIDTVNNTAITSTKGKGNAEWLSSGKITNMTS